MAEIIDIKKVEELCAGIYLKKMQGSSDYDLTLEIDSATKECKSIGVNGFKDLFKMYCKKQGYQTIDKVTEFTGLDMELYTGNWTANDEGIYSISNGFRNEACCHPIAPIQRLVNIDTGVVKLRLAFKRGHRWREIIADKKTLASPNSILELANSDIAVTSNNAKYLIDYLHDVDNINYEALDEKYSVSRLGWVDGYGFSPYVENLVFDGDGMFKSFFDTVEQRGSLDKWRETAVEARKNGTPAKIILASSFASVLVSKLNCLIFFVHLWGGTEVGKTVGLMLAASVWGNPPVGKYIKTYSSTTVGLEKYATFVNNLPLILDEFQFVKTGNGNFEKEIYMLCNGTGKTRGNKQGGVDKSGTWSFCVLSSGETPITNGNSAGGVVNRIIEIECQKKLFSNSRQIADTVRENYGYAGHEWVEWLTIPENLERVKSTYTAVYDELIKSDTTEKQAASAAVIVTADRLVTEIIFKDDNALTVDEMSSFLASKSAVSSNERAYQYMCQWVISNINKFKGDSDVTDIWGKLIDAEIACILTEKFDRALIEGGYSPAPVLSYLRENNLIECQKGTFKSVVKINGISARCVKLKLNRDETTEFDEENPPF